MDAQPAPVQDAEGENRAVRSFLLLYGQRGTVGGMKRHMGMSGFKSWPAWVDTEPEGAHLTKAGAQLWIRHLFALEASQPAQSAPTVQEPVALDELTDIFHKAWKKDFKESLLGKLSTGSEELQGQWREHVKAGIRALMAAPTVQKLNQQRKASHDTHHTRKNH
jgi:hypothetical protein